MEQHIIRKATAANFMYTFFTAQLNRQADKQTDRQI